MSSESWPAPDGHGHPERPADAVVARNHYLPRTLAGRIALVVFLVLLALAQPPFVHSFANRIGPRVLGTPFLYAYLSVIYCGMIAVLLWARLRGL